MITDIDRHRILISKRSVFIGVHLWLLLLIAGVQAAHHPNDQRPNVLLIVTDDRPACLEAGLRINELTCHRDWLPTLIELCGLKQPPAVQLDGRSIAPLLQAKDDPWPDRMMFVQNQPDQPKLVQISHKPAGYPNYAVLTEQWRMVGGELYDHRTDPSQRQNVASDHPDVVSDLYAQYQQHFTDVFAEGKPYARFQLGGPENPTLMTVRDWHPVGEPPANRVIWKQEQLADNSIFIQGFWAVDVEQEGMYSIRLSRHPEDAPAAMGASVARLQIGDSVAEKRIAPEDETVTFEVLLPVGHARIQAWLEDATTGGRRGAYFVEVELKYETNP